jgi:hypothetical protein
MNRGGAERIQEQIPSNSHGTKRNERQKGKGDATLQKEKREGDATRKKGTLPFISFGREKGDATLYFLRSSFFGLPRGRYCNARPTSFSNFWMSFCDPQRNPLSAWRRRTSSFSFSSPPASHADQFSMLANCLATIAALGDVMGHASADGAGQSRHLGNLTRWKRAKKGSVPFLLAQLQHVLSAIKRH